MSKKIETPSAKMKNLYNEYLCLRVCVRVCKESKMQKNGRHETKAWTRNELFRILFFEFFCCTSLSFRVDKIKDLRFRINLKISLSFL